MTKNKKATRKEQQRVQREKRRTPFNVTTKLIELVDKRHYGDIVQLVKRLRPYLKDGERVDFVLTKLDLKLDIISTEHLVLITYWLILKKVRPKHNGIKAPMRLMH